MSCFFCESFYHLSQYCDVYPSDESRKQYLQSKNLCSNCLTGYYGSFLSYIFGHSCQIGNIKCYICFNRHHHNIYCPERFAISSTKLFLPNIDRDLFHRYLKWLNLKEQNLLALSSPEAYNAIKPKKMVICDTFMSFEDKKFNDSILVVRQGIFFENATSNLRSFQMISRASIVSIIHSSLSAEQFLQLLSSNTKEIYCINVKLTSKLEFGEIIKKVPNIKKINFWETNVVFEYSWPNNFIQRKVGNDFQSLTISTEYVNFDVEALAQFVKTKSTKNAQYYLYVEVSPYTPFNSSYDKENEMLFRKLSKYFVQTKASINDEPTLTVISRNKGACYTCF